jgi:GT2 family glycosyltransferase
MDLSIIIVNWNSEFDLGKCIESIQAHTSGIEYEIIVVDNASPTNGIDDVGRHFPSIRIIKSSTNLGFSGANNLGFRQSKGRVLLFLNPDTMFVGPAIHTLITNLDTLPDAGAIGGRLLNTDLSLQTSCIQTFPTIMNQLFDVEVIRLRWPGCKLWNTAPLYSSSKEPTPVDVVSGACLMLRRNVFEQIGEFSEDYFMYADDIDLCYRAQQAGFTNYHVGNAVLVHHGGTSSKQQAVRQWATMMKFAAMAYFLRKTRGRGYANLFRLSMGCAAIVRVLAVLALRIVGDRVVQREYALSKWKAVLKWASGLNARELTATTT